jgi:hypothetical protein
LLINEMVQRPPAGERADECPPVGASRAPAPPGVHRYRECLQRIAQAGGLRLETVGEHLGIEALGVLDTEGGGLLSRAEAFLPHRRLARGQLLLPAPVPVRPLKTVLSPYRPAG